MAAAPWIASVSDVGMLIRSDLVSSVTNKQRVPESDGNEETQ